MEFKATVHRKQHMELHMLCLVLQVKTLHLEEDARTEIDYITFQELACNNCTTLKQRMTTALSAQRNSS